MQTNFLDVFAAELLTDGHTQPATNSQPQLSRRRLTASERHRNATYHEPRNAGRRPTSRQRVFECLSAQGRHGATREEIALLTGMKLSSVCGRVAELLDEPQPKIYQDGTKRKGPHPDSQPQTVVFATE